MRLKHIVSLQVLLAALSCAALGAAQDFTAADCADCHADSGGDPVEVGMEDLAGCVHEDLDCLDCHASIADLPHDEDLPPVACGTCHEDEADTYLIHGRGVVGKSDFVPSCADCHGTHGILSSLDRDATTNPLNLPTTCGKCHEDSTLTHDLNIKFKHPIRVYSESVHGKATAGGIHQAASCNDCHSTGGSAHMILPPNDPRSTIAHFNIPKTCGQCHGAIEQDYWDGVHGQLTARGEVDTPTCTTCHGEHGILHTQDPRSPVSPYRLAEATCTPCHESATLNEKYELPTGRLQSFVDSYHGLKSKAGDKTVANCASCHGAHLILPSDDERSSVNSRNLQNTCGHCHKGITADVARQPIHETATGHRTGVAHIIQIIYTILIACVIGGMVLHWLIDLIKRIHEVINKKPQVRRMEPNEVFQHTILALSFTILVITGFSLRFYDAWWSHLLFGREGGYAVRGVIHRGAAVLMILGSVFHAFFLITPRGREFLRDMVPTANDVRQFLQRMKFNLGLSGKTPRFGRFTYVEKAEYWALIWGTVIMVITGFALWFDNLVVQWFPRGFMDVMLVIHYYEAWLAFLAILIWHMYATVFNPGVYPMNPAWIHGMMPQDMYEHEHPDVKLVKHEREVRTRVESDACAVSEPGRTEADSSGFPRG
ncbi:cytochrome b/b6 domain-containing protein [bacterium]|nr:cytochrome b/b6 domain-containing protein [bacterium]MBU1072228.1 cytochrome b/b6 domain-containing protein [bacterium]MBU1674451.1 cytochrome b/b6 domain-containing protein [bacterium]